MEVVKTNIYKQLKRNNLIVWVVVIVSGLVSIYSVYTVEKVSANADRFIYSISSNEKLLPLEQIEKSEVLHIYKKSHVQLFLENFYGYDQWNYKQRIERALWLIDDEGKDLYNFYREDGHFNRMIQTTSSQTILDVQPHFDKEDNFMVSAIIEINRVNQEQPKRYQLTAKGKLLKVSENYPVNPYGYVITDYKEINKKELKNE